MRVTWAPFPTIAVACATTSALEDADGDDRVVGQLAARQRHDRFLRLVGAGEDVRGAELAGLLALEGDRVDHDEVLRAGVRGTLDGVHAHAAGAEDDDGVAGADLGHVDRGAPAGGHPATDERGDLERDVVVDTHAASRLVDDGVAGEGAQHAEAAHAGAVLVVEAEASVAQLARLQLRAPVAQVLPPGRAVAAERRRRG